MAEPGQILLHSRPWVPGLIVLLSILVVAADVLFLPFFSDDFHLVDVGRNRSLIELLGGRYGITPWYRPLSRELYFALLAHAGPFGALLGHAILAGAVALGAVLVHRIGSRLVSPLAGAIAAIVFVTYEATKFLASWASGFQDLLAAVLTLAAVDAMQSARYRATLLLAAMAPLAKEPAFIVYPILLLYLAIFRPPREGRPGARMLVLSALVPVTLHLLARSTWTSGVPFEPAKDLDRLGVVFAGAIRFFFGGDMLPTFRGLLLAAAATGVAWLCLRLAGSQEREPAAPPQRRAVAWIACAGLLGASPAIAGHLLLTYTHPYHLIPAVPWLCMLIGALVARGPGVAAQAGVPALVFWNALTLGTAPIDLNDPLAWDATPFTWRDALRTTSVTNRLAADLRTILADRPESLVVVFQNMPPRTFLQTEDGPAIRELLRDPTLRSYWSSEAPWLPEERGVRILTFDFDSLHLRPAKWSRAGALHEASNAIIAGRGGTAAAILRYAIPAGEAEPARTYLLASSELVAGGPAAYLRRLKTLGWADSTAPGLIAIARARAADDPTLTLAHLGVLRRPLTASSLTALADSYAVHGTVQGAAFGLRLAVTLKPDLWAERLRLADTILELGGGREAMEELSLVASSESAGAYATRARERIAALEAAEEERLRATARPPATP